MLEDLQNFFQLDRDRQLEVLAIAETSISTQSKSEVLLIETSVWAILSNPFGDTEVRIAAADVLEVHLGNTRF